MSFEELKQKVTDKSNKLKLIHTVWLCLEFVEHNPDSKFEIGIFWNSNSHFMINTFIFGMFVNRKPNTINRNFRSHGFCYKKTTFEMRDALNECLPDSKNWILRWCDGFTKSTTESEAISWRYNELIIKKPKILKIKEEKCDSYYEKSYENFMDFNIPDNLDINEMFCPLPPADDTYPKEPFDKFDNMDIIFDLGSLFHQNEQDFSSLFN